MSRTAEILRELADLDQRRSELLRELAKESDAEGAPVKDPRPRRERGLGALLVAPPLPPPDDGAQGDVQRRLRKATMLPTRKA